MSNSNSPATPSGRSEHNQSKLLFYIMLPLIVLALASAWMITSDPLRLFVSSAPPIENLTIEQHYLDDSGINLKVRAGGSEPMIIAQIQVDDAYWNFSQNPAGPLPRFSTAWINIPFPWVKDDTHIVNLVTNSGATFELEIEVAVKSTRGTSGSILSHIILGLFVGVLPVALGLMLFPALQQLQRGGMRFVLAMTFGMLAFLLIDTLEEALEAASKAAAAFQGSAMVLLIALISTLGLIAVGRRKGKAPSGVALAGYMALGIGLHNFGEGLAIGAALAAGAAGLGAFLVLGFTVHNLTEGVAIASPMIKKRPSLVTFLGLTLLAGAPAIFGLWVGSFAVANHWIALALAIGTGAIIQVLFEIGSLIIKNDTSKSDWMDRYALTGLIFGIGFMYLTGMYIKT